MSDAKSPTTDPAPSSTNKGSDFLVARQSRFRMDQIIQRMNIGDSKLITEENFNSAMTAILGALGFNIKTINQEALRRKISFYAVNPSIALTIAEQLMAKGYTLENGLYEKIKKYTLDTSSRGTTTITVTEMLGKMAVSMETAELIKNHAEHFVSFGMSTSHTLRERLNTLFEKAKMSNDARFLVYLFAAQVKNKTRIENELAKLPASFTGVAEVSEARKFINDYLVQYVTEETSGNKFAIVHLPTTFPGMDILCHMLVTPRNRRSINALYERLTFAQIHISSSLVEKCREAQKNFWEKKVMTTRNSNNKSFTPVFQESFFNTSAADQYKLYSMNDSLGYVEISPSDPSVGYSEDEIKEYLQECPCWISEE